MHHELDLLGIKCPLNWARAKVKLSELSRGDVLELLVADEQAVRDIPRAAEAEGHAIVDVRHEVRQDGMRWRIIIEC
jgi:sulfite reductase (ferredoxin)